MRIAYVRGSLDADEVALLRLRIKRIADAFAGIDPTLSLEGCRLLHPGTSHVDVRPIKGTETIGQVRVWVDPTDLASAHQIDGPCADAPTDAGSLVALLRGWRRDLSAPVHRLWGARRGREAAQDAADRASLIVAAHRPALVSSYVSVRHPSRIEPTGAVELQGDRKATLHPEIERSILAGLEPVVHVSMDGNRYLLGRCDDVVSRVEDGMDAMERLRVMAAHRHLDRVVQRPPHRRARRPSET